MNNKITKAEDFGKVAVLFGGISSEREVSLISGKNVLSALLNLGIDAYGIDVGYNIIEQLQKIKPDRAFIVLHGQPLGEDGTIQSLLEIMQIPYTGSGVMASALTMDKQRTDLLWKGLGLPVIPSIILKKETDPAEIEARFAAPLCVKPVNSGSSCGVTKVEVAEQLPEAYKLALQHGSAAMVQPWIMGRELTVGILGNEPLPAIEIVTPKNTFYDYSAKYLVETTQYLCPCDLTAAEEQEIKDLALRAFNSVGCKDWGRIDFIQDKDKKFWLLEANTIPGMTEHSLVPKAAKQAGISFERLVWQILAFTL
jgi:D-alanine-D-alanine ligase